MPTKPKKTKAQKPKIAVPMPKKRPLPPGVKGTKVEDYIGQGKNLWKTDEELDEFLAEIRERRKY